MTGSNEARQVSVIGIGDMGSALAEALLAKGHRVTVWNRTVTKCGALAEAGASVAASVPKAAAAAQVLIVCVLNHDASVALLQTDEVARSLRGKLLLQLSTVTAEESRALGHWAEENGIEYLDGSILGYRQDVLNNDCAVVYSGPKSVFDANEGVLSAMGGKPRFVSEAIGGAATFDKSIYAEHYGSMLASFHGAAICHAAGFPLETYLELTVADGEPNKARFGEMLVKRSYDGGAFDVDVAAYAHVTRLSEELGIDAAFPRTVASYLDRAVAEGRVQQQLAAIFELMLPTGET
jgi:3-hydroxyisobutyrate dehydrogenase-like beta-hydroxyacid dehydrogenase